VMGADEFGGIDGSRFQGRIDVGMRKIVRLGADPLEDRSAQRSDANPQTLEILERVDFLLEPRAHLRAGAAGRDAVGVELLQGSIDDLVAPAESPPGELVSGIETEGQAAPHAEHGVLVERDMQGCECAVDRSAGYGIERLAAWRQLAGRIGLDLELVVRGL